MLAGILLAAAASVFAQTDNSRGPQEYATPSVVPPASPPRPTQAQFCDASSLPREKALATPRLRRLLTKGNDVRIAAFGSSTTMGQGASAQATAYPLQLQAILRSALKHAYVNVDNMGAPGEIAAETAVRILTELSSDPPGFLVWQVGVNDGMNDTPVTRFESVLRSTIDATRRANVEMLLVGQQYTAKLAANAHYTAIGRSIERVAREKGVAYVDSFAAMRAMVAVRGKEDMLSDDNFHLNDFGYRCLAEQIGKVIVDGLRAGNS